MNWFFPLLTHFTFSTFCTNEQCRKIELKRTLKTFKFLLKKEHCINIMKLKMALGHHEIQCGRSKCYTNLNLFFFSACLTVNEWNRKINYIAVVEDNHAPWLLADGGLGRIHLRCNNNWLHLIPKCVFAEHEVGQVLGQTCSLKYFNLERRWGKKKKRKRKAFIHQGMELKTSPSRTMFHCKGLKKNKKSKQKNNLANKISALTLIGDSIWSAVAEDSH